jgi:hypothetical protein
MPVRVALDDDEGSSGSDSPTASAPNCVPDLGKHSELGATVPTPPSENHELGHPDQGPFSELIFRAKPAASARRPDRSRTPRWGPVLKGTGKQALELVTQSADVLQPRTG